MDQNLQDCQNFQDVGFDCNREMRMDAKEMTICCKEMSVFAKEMNVDAKEMTICCKEMSVFAKEMNVDGKNMEICCKDMSVCDRETSAFCKEKLPAIQV